MTLLEQCVRAAEVLDDDDAATGRAGLEGRARGAFDTTTDEEAVEARAGKVHSTHGTERQAEYCADTYWN